MVRSRPPDQKRTTRIRSGPPRTGTRYSAQDQRSTIGILHDRDVIQFGRPTIHDHDSKNEGLCGILIPTVQWPTNDQESVFPTHLRSRRRRP
jgi:hypothetical protein